MQNKAQLTILLLIISVGLMAAIVFTSRSNSQTSPTPDTSSENNQTQPDQEETQVVIYTTTACPFCREVEQWIEENDVESYLEIVHKEVSTNRVSSLELVAAAKDCGLNPDSIGVPFLSANGECLVGKLEIIEYLQQKIEEKIAEEQSIPAEDLE